MAEPNANVPQAIDPEVTADLTRLLQIRGPLGILNVLDTIVPIVSLGNVVTPDINIRPPIFRSTDVFSAGLLAAPVVNTILADTLALPAGTYDVIVLMNVAETGGAQGIAFEHRNAANAANLMILTALVGIDVDNPGFDHLTFSYVLAVNERLRLRTTGGSSVGSNYSCAIFARIR